PTRRSSDLLSRPPSEESALARVLRRDRNPREARASARSRRRGSRPGDRGESATTLESTRGRGRKAPGGRSKRTRARANAATRIERYPYSSLPGPAQSRRATSLWTVTRERAIVSGSSIAALRIGVAAL